MSFVKGKKWDVLRITARWPNDDCRDCTGTLIKEPGSIEDKMFKVPQCSRGYHRENGYECPIASSYPGNNYKVIFRPASNDYIEVRTN